jgi:twitching motility protein PilT
LDTPAEVPVPNSVVAKPKIPVAALLSAMLRASTRVSDLIFSPGSQPHIEVSGQLVPVRITGLPTFGAEDTRRIAEELVGDNQQALTMLRQQGSCDISYSLPGECRFRVNIFVQRGSHAIVMRVIPKTVAPVWDSFRVDRRLEDHIRTLCAKLINAEDDEGFQSLATELRHPSKNT